MKTFTSNKFLALCLFGVALIVCACYAAELPTDAAAVPTTPQPKTIGREIDEEVEWPTGDDEEDEEYDMGISDSPEEDLAELSAEHFEVKQDCADLATMIQEAKTNSSTVDPNLQQAYDQCEQDLKDIEGDMQTLSAQISSED